MSGISNFLGYKASTNIYGAEDVINALNIEIEKIKGRSLNGLYKVAALIKNETEKGDVTVPIDLGNLRHSWFTVGSSTAIRVGGRSHTPEGLSGTFIGPKAAQYASGHSAMLTEMKQYADTLAKAADGPFVVIGYSVDYALWVHENQGAHFKQGKKTNRGWKWFEKAIRKHQNNIVKIVSDNAKIR